jgi:para-aminobenzoate synthetase/4-amino-4-deoxychorismate lyase
MNVIAELESTTRGVYTGAIGFASPAAGLELAVAIRTFEFADGRAWLGVGGGIVADSDPAGEARECATKAAPLLAAIGAQTARGGHAMAGPLPPSPRRLAPLPTPRPDPAAGIFETLLVVDGRPVELDEHLARLSASARTLYGMEIHDDVGEDLCAQAAGHDRARLRVNLRPDRGVDVELSEVPARVTPTTLHPVSVAGGLGAHKWIDRRLLGALSVDGEPLLCDLDGYVLETARANVFVVTGDGWLLTPPTDGRILPGVTRTRVLALADELQIPVAVRPLHLAELAAANEVFLTGSLAGVEPARCVGDRHPQPGKTVTAHLRTNLYKTLPSEILR